MTPKEKYHYVGRNPTYPENEPIDTPKSSLELIPTSKNPNQLTTIPKRFQPLSVNIIVGFALSCGFVLDHGA